MASETCKLGENCHYGECINNVCDCLGTFVSGEQCSEEMLTHPALYGFVAAWVLVYAVLLWLMLRELREWAREGKFHVRIGASQILLCGIIGHAGWMLFIAAQVFMWSPEAARASKALGIFFAAFLMPAITIGTTRILHILARAKAAANGLRTNCFWRHAMIPAYVISFGSFGVRVFWLLPLSTQCLACVFAVDTFHAALGLVVLQVSATFYGRHALRVMSRFPEKNARVLEKTKLVTFYQVPMTVFTLTYILVNFFYPIDFGEAGVAWTLVYDGARNLMILMYTVMFWTFTTRRNYTMLEAIRFGFFILPSSNKLEVSRHRGTMLHVRTASSSSLAYALPLPDDPEPEPMPAADEAADVEAPVAQQGNEDVAVVQQQE